MFGSTLGGMNSKYSKPAKVVNSCTSQKLRTDTKCQQLWFGPWTLPSIDVSCAALVTRLTA